MAPPARPRYEPPRLFDVAPADERAYGLTGECTGGKAASAGQCTGGNSNAGISCGGGNGNQVSCGGGQGAPRRRRQR